VDYRAYGMEVMDAPRPGPGYTGHYRDVGTGLVYMQQRYYDPAIGRFVSVDLVAVREGGDNFNRYNYGANNPYKYVDPDGREIRYFQQGEEEIRAQIAAAKASTPEIRQMIEALENSPNVHNIGSFDDSPTEMLQANNTATGPGESDLTGTGTNTYYDPGRSPVHHGIKQSPVEILVHELKHAYMKDQGIMPAQDAPPDPETGNPAREQPAIDMQNDYRRSQGEETMIEEYY
jgi:RHS repeat-associated protein